MKRAILTAALFTGLSVGARAQSPTVVQVLDLWEAHLELQSAAGQMDRAQQLRERGLIDERSFDTDRLAYESARVAQNRALAALVDPLHHLTIESAIKSEDGGGRRFVEVVIANHRSTGGAEQLAREVAGAEAQWLERLDLEAVSDLYVSLKDRGSSIGGGFESAFLSPAQEVIISKPYEARIDRLGPGERQRLRFALLRDVENVTVAFRHGSRTESRSVKLEYDASAPLRVDSSQISQEAFLSSTAVYDLRLERSSGGAVALQLGVEDLPPQIRYEFLEPTTGARLSYINLLAGVASKRLDLRLTLPAAPHPDLPLDETLTFAARITPTEGEAATVQLQLIPRGLGEITVGLPTHYHEVEAGRAVETEVVLRNTGSQRIDEVRFASDLPPGWRSELQPDRVPELGVAQEARLRLRILPSATAQAGEFSLRLSTLASANQRPLDVQDQIVRIKVIRPASLWGFGLVIALTGLVVLGGLGWAVRATRR